MMRTLAALYTAFIAWVSNPYDAPVVLGWFAVSGLLVWWWIIIAARVQEELHDNA